MIKTYAMLIDELSDYAAPANKLMRMVDAGEVTPIVRGLYETNPSTSPYLLAASIYGPSYLSFEFALSVHGLIPEKVAAITCATFEKRKKRTYSTNFGRFTYQDVPSRAFPLGLTTLQEGDYFYRIACPEKALCDQLYKSASVRSVRALKELLFADLRIDETQLARFDAEKIRAYAEAYRCTNIRLLGTYLAKERS
jgi:predicted transcriptional regulator of viral defense system